ncbi:MAG: hypothetical protein H5U16_00030 [Roseovarius sp.]|nr:hypothetical protein [Roseovarius sp.]
MKLFRLICAGVAAATLAPVFTTVTATQASAQSAQDVLPLVTDDIEQFRSWENWTILRNNTRGHCFGTKSSDRAILQMGVTGDGEMGYVGVFVKDEGIPRGDERPENVAILLGERAFVGGIAELVQAPSAGWFGGYVLSGDRDFRRAIEANDVMVVFPDTPYVVMADIRGANNAIFEIAKCSDEMSN